MLDNRETTKEGLEKTLATNTGNSSDIKSTYVPVSNFLLTNLLMPVLLKSPDPKLIIVSSGGTIFLVK